MKLLHKLSINKDHFILVWDNGSDSNYNRFYAVVLKTNLKNYLIGGTIKEDSKKEYIQRGVEDLKRYTKDSNMTLLGELH